MFILTFMLAWTNGANLITLKPYQEPRGEEYLSLPHASIVGSDGRLYVLDPSQPRILVWHKDGSFAMGFGKKGEGPGELMEPVQIAMYKRQIYVWQADGRMTHFDDKGQYLDQFRLVGPQPRRMAMLDEDHAFITHMSWDMGGVYFMFELRDRQNQVKQLKKDLSSGWQKVGTDTQVEEINTYMGDVDIQVDPAGGYFFGYGDEKKIYHLSAKGTVDATLNFELPKRKPSAEDRRHMEEKEVVGGDGKRISIKNLPNLKLHFESDCAYFTQFIVKGDRIAFILTSLGGAHGVGDGDSRASYTVCELKTGKVVARGAYELAQDSQVHYRNGHIIAFESSDDGYLIREVNLKGL